MRAGWQYVGGGGVWQRACAIFDVFQSDGKRELLFIVRRPLADIPPWNITSTVITTGDEPAWRDVTRTNFVYLWLTIVIDAANLRERISSVFHFAFGSFQLRSRSCQRRAAIAFCSRTRTNYTDVISTMVDGTVRLRNALHVRREDRTGHFFTDRNGHFFE